jgi:hypothetical protein
MPSSRGLESSLSNLTEPSASTVVCHPTFTVRSNDCSQALLQLWWERSGGQATCYFNKDAVAFDVSQARRAAAQVLLDKIALLGRQLIGIEFNKQLDEVAAGDHAGFSSK